ncbi:MAG: autotransporter outer membrane beta-barrel domain-containing protein, partial [Synechococcus sp.]|nr:autotransporter outer membrane beta-barrel domain-containing protein [Synechococcus sp.]
TDNPNLTSIYTEPDGTRAWVRGFGGSMSPYDTGGAYGKRGVVFYDDVYNNFYSTHSGLVVGIDTSLTDNIQLGFFGNYGNINLTQFAGRDTGGGSWNPDGYGGGVMASYWSDNFYVQGAFGATAFSGDNKRQVKIGTIVNETYIGSKYTTSYMGTVRVGAPFAWGGVILEPQATAIWNHNQDASYTETGRYQAFALKVNSYTDNFLQTAIGTKLAWPIKQGERNLIVPNIKVAWLADWDTDNGAVSFKRAFTRRGRKARTAEIPSNQEQQYGVLLEGGVDYAIAQGPTTAWKLYAKGGAKLWMNKAADWRTSGGITFQF